MGAVPDSVPTAPMSSSLAWLVAGAVPDENALVVALAPAEVSIPVTPENSSTLTYPSSAETHVSVILAPAASAFIPVAVKTTVRSPAEPSLTSRATT